MPSPTLAWTHTALATVVAQASHPSPAERRRIHAPMLARSMALLHRALYNVWAVHDPIARPTIAGGARRPATSPQERDTAMHLAAYAVLADQFPADQPRLERTLRHFGIEPSGTKDLTLPAGVANQVVTAILAEAHRDGANQLGEDTATGLPYDDVSGYVPVNPPFDWLAAPTAAMTPRPDRWQPLAGHAQDSDAQVQTFAAAHWGRVRPFALKRGSQYRPQAPVHLDSQAFVDQLRHLLDLQHSPAEHKPEPWTWWTRSAVPAASPVAQWYEIWCGHAQAQNLSVDDTVRLFFAGSQALQDAAIATWDAKRHFDYCRPLPALHRARGGQAGPAHDLLATTGSPGHCCAHSALSAAAAEVLRRHAHSDLIPPKALMPWTRYSSCAEDAGLARLQAGLNFYEAHSAGARLGQRVAALAFERAADYWLGRA